MDALCSPAASGSTPVSPLIIGAVIGAVIVILLFVLAIRVVRRKRNTGQAGRRPVGHAGDLVQAVSEYWWRMEELVVRPAACCGCFFPWILCAIHSVPPPGR